MLWESDGLERASPAECDMFRLIDNAHPAFRQSSDDDVGPDGLAAMELDIDITTRSARFRVLPSLGAGNRSSILLGHESRGNPSSMRWPLGGVAARSLALSLGRVRTTLVHRYGAEVAIRGAVCGDSLASS